MLHRVAPLLCCLLGIFYAQGTAAQEVSEAGARYELVTLKIEGPELDEGAGQEEAVRQADHFIKTGELKVAEEKQLFDCMIINADNADKYSAPFVLSE